MSQHTASSESPQSVFGWPVALQLMILIVICIGAAVLQNATDSFRRPALELVSEKSAIGDTVFFVPTDSTTQMRFQGRTLIAAEAKPEEFRDVRMVREGCDESGTYSIYKLVEEKEKADKPSSKAENPPGTLYLKTAQDSFLRLKAE